MPLVFLFLFFLPLYCDVVLQTNPSQGINSTDNYANRQVYFFVQRNSDNSLTLQVGPPPFYASDATLLKTSAYIDSETVIKNYSVTDLVGKTELEIEFTLKAFPNKSSANGYSLYGSYQVGTLSLATKESHYLSMQSVNISIPYSLNYLYDANVNPDNGVFIIYSDLSHQVHWFSLEDGMMFSDSFTDNKLFATTIPNTDFTETFKIKVDISHIAVAAPGTYSIYFFFQMNAIPTTQTDETTYEEIATYQIEGINYVYNTIMKIIGNLQGTNALYEPGVIETNNLNTNKVFLEVQYKEMLTAITKQWKGFSALPNLSMASQNIITQMQTFLEQAKDRENQF